jgi:hypothetical protein
MTGHLINQHHHLHHPHHLGHHSPIEAEAPTVAKAAVWIFGIGCIFGGPVGGAVALAGAGGVVGAIHAISRAREKSDNI